MHILDGFFGMGSFLARVFDRFEKRRPPTRSGEIEVKQSYWDLLPVDI